MTYGERLKDIRLSNKMKQYQVADALGISRSSYCSYETGRRSIDLDIITKLSFYYRLPVNAFFDNAYVEDVDEKDIYEEYPDLKYLSTLSSDEIAIIAKCRVMCKEDKKEVKELVDSKVESRP